MAKEIERLTPFRVKALTQAGRHADGGNLYLVISESGAKAWAFMYRLHGRTHEAGLGAAADVPLKSARAKAKEGRELLSRKPPVDPLTVWRRPERERIPIFHEAAHTYLESKADAWRSAKHKRQLETMLIGRGKIPGRCGAIARTFLDEVATADVLKVIKPIFDRTPDTALRLRGAIESVLNAARGARPGSQSLKPPARYIQAH
jgi:hypothetical protein